MRLQAFSLVIGPLCVVGGPVSNSAVSSSLRWKLCCTSRSKGSAGGESLLSQCGRAARPPSVLAVLWCESCHLGFSDSLSNSMFILRDTKSAATIATCND